MHHLCEKHARNVSTIAHTWNKLPLSDYLCNVVMQSLLGPFLRHLLIRRGRQLLDKFLSSHGLLGRILDAVALGAKGRPSLGVSGLRTALRADLVDAPANVFRPTASPRAHLATLSELVQAVLLIKHLRWDGIAVDAEVMVAKDVVAVRPDANAPFFAGEPVRPVALASGSREATGKLAHTDLVSGLVCRMVGAAFARPAACETFAEHVRVGR